MSRRQSLDRPGILSPPGPFLTPSPSPSVSASPRLQPSPSISPFPQDVLVVTGNTITNTTQEQERKAATPGRRQSIHQYTTGSPNAGTVVFQPSPSQSPAAATTVIGVTGNEFNTTLVGSNNISLNKKGNKRTSQGYTGYGGQVQAINSSNSFATANVASSPKGQAKKATILPTSIIHNSSGNTAQISNNSQQQQQQHHLHHHHQQQQQQHHHHQQQHQQQQHHNHHNQNHPHPGSSPLIADSPIASPSGGIKPPTPQPPQMLQQFPVVSAAGNQIFQLIQSPQLIAAAQQQLIAQQNSQQQRGTATVQTHHHNANNQQQQQQQQLQQHIQHQLNLATSMSSGSHLANVTSSANSGGVLHAVTHTAAKSVKAPQQILPKPQSTNDKLAKGQISQSPQLQQQQQQQLHQQQQQQQSNSVNTTTGGGQTSAHATGQQIILPTGNLNTQPLLLNQMPVLVQQNTPQGVQLILRPPTPQLATPSLVIHNTRPQLQQQQPQQLLRILNTNGAMQLATTPTFIVSSQANLIQQANLQTIKTNTNQPAITQLSGLHAALAASSAAPRTQQFINSHILGQSVAAQLQNLQLNGNHLAQIQMPNGLNGPILSQLPTQFQQSLAGYNQINQNINLNQLNSTNIQQIAAAAAAAGAAFQSPPPQHVGDLQMSATATVMPSQNIQFSTSIASPAVTPQPQMVPSVTPEPARNPTPVSLQNVMSSPQHTNNMNASGSAQPVQTKTHEIPFHEIKVRKPKPRKKKNPPPQPPPVVATTPSIGMMTSTTTTTTSPQTNTISTMSDQTVSNTATAASSNPEASPPPVARTKLDLGNVMKLCGIMEDDDDFMDCDEQIQPPPPPPPPAQSQPQTQAQAPQTSQQDESKSTPSSSDIMISIPGQNSDIPFTFSIPASATQQQSSEPIKSQPDLRLQSSNVVDVNGMETGQNILIKIDQNDSTQPYTISIPRLPTADEVQQQNQPQQLHLSTQQSQKPVSANTGITYSMAQTLTSSSATTSAATSSITAPPAQMPAVTSGHQNPQMMRHSGTIQSRINEVQNQLIAGSGVNLHQQQQQQHHSQQNQSGNNTGANGSAAVTPSSSTPVTTTAAVKPRRKPTVRRNGKKVEAALAAANAASVAAAASAAAANSAASSASTTTAIASNSGSQSLMTSVGQVPSQIGNIQISQVDTTKATTLNQPPVGGAVENKIQIMPILDNAGVKIGNHSAPRQQNHNHHPPHQSSQIVFNQPQMQQQQQQQQQQQIQQQQQQQDVNAKVALEVANPAPRQQFPQITGNVSTAVSALIPQLTGSLSLAFTEHCEGLLLRHDPNAPQDQQSQCILQALLKGALPNLTIINEPSGGGSALDKSKITPCVLSTNTTLKQANTSQSTGAISKIKSSGVQLQINIQQQQHQTHSQQHTQVAQAEPKRSAEPKQTVTKMHHTKFQQQQQMQQHHNAHTPPTQHQQQQQQHQQQQQQQHQQQLSQQQHQKQNTTIVVNPNVQKFVALPKVESNQQLFCLNTVTNQITQINPGQTTASLGPMERLLIAPAGINAQQLAHCLSQGQIHFDNVNPTNQPAQQAAPTTAASAPAPRIQQQQIVHPQQHQPVQPIQPLQQPTQAPPAKQVANVAPIIDQSKAKMEPKPKKTKPRKPKICQESTAPPKNAVKPMPKLDLSVKPNTNPVQIVQPNVAKSTHHLPTTTNNTSTTTMIHPFQSQSSTGTKLIGVTAPMQQQHRNVSNNSNGGIGNNSNTNLCNNSNSNISNNSTSNNNSGSSLINQSPSTSLPLQPHQQSPPMSASTTAGSQMMSSSASMSHTSANASAGLTANTSLQGNQTQQQQSQLQMQPQPHPVPQQTTTTVSRVQTIQLTPEQQQLLKTVQMHIQQLSAKMQNKTLLSTLNIPTDLDTNNPIYSKPLPSLNNLQNMSDAEIYTALQGLFIEQQRILASGKLIPTPGNFVPGQNFTLVQQPPFSMQPQQQAPPPQPPTVQPPVVNEQQQQLKSVGNFENKVSLTNSTNSHNLGVIRSEGQAIPANIVQPNNHNTTVAPSTSNTSTQRIHIYPMQHHQQQQQNKPMHQQQQQIQQKQQQQMQKQQQQQQQQQQLNVQQQQQQQHQPQVQHQQLQQQIQQVVKSITKDGKHTVNIAPPQQQAQPQVQPLVQTSRPTQQAATVIHQHLSQPSEMPKTAPSATQISSVVTAKIETETKTTGLVPTQPLPAPQQAPTATAQQPAQQPLPQPQQQQYQQQQQQQQFQPQQPLPAPPQQQQLQQQQPMPQLQPQTQPQPQTQQSALMPMAQALPLSHATVTTTTTTTTAISCASTLPIESPKPKLARLSLFIRQLEVDQRSCLNPDYVNPFLSKEEAVKRLVRYHCMYENDEDIPSEEEEEFETTALQLEGKFKNIAGKYQQLLLYESMRHHRTSEVCQINQLLVRDLQQELLDMRADTCPQTQHNPYTHNNSVISNPLSAVSTFKPIKREFDNQSNDSSRSTPIHHQSHHVSQWKHQADLISSNSSSNSNSNGPMKNEVKSEPSEYGDGSKVNFHRGMTPVFNNTSHPHNMQAMYAKQNCMMSIKKDEKDGFGEKQMFFPCSKMSVAQFNGHKKESGEDVKKEFIDNLDIESEITPSFIMKKGHHNIQHGGMSSLHGANATIGNSSSSCAFNNLKANRDLPLSELAPEFQVNCFASANADAGFNNHPSSGAAAFDIDKKQESCDEWLCIQNLISEKKSEQQHAQGSRECSSTNQLADIFENATSPKDLSELFENGKDHQQESTHHQHHIQHLSEYFNPESVVNKSVENRLEAMFGESPVVDKGETTQDMVESGLEELFSESPSPAGTANCNSINAHQHFNSAAAAAGGSGITSENNSDKTRSWASDLIAPTASSSPYLQAGATRRAQQQQPQQQSSCSFMEQQTHQIQMSNNPQWMQTMEAQLHEFMSSTVQEQHMVNGATEAEGRKRPWNGDMLDSSHQDMKKMCFVAGSKPDDHQLVDPDLLSLHDPTGEIMRHTTSIQHNAAIASDNGTGGFQQMLNLHQQQQQQQHAHFHRHHLQQMHHSQIHGSGILDAAVMGMGGTGAANLSGGSSGSLSSNFDDDISRHVQNAIDSILNLQNSEGDSLTFPLDHSMGSFLSESMLEHSQHQTSAVVNSHCALAGSVQDPSDCLISGGGPNATGDNSNMMVDSPTSSVMSGSTTGGSAGGRTDAVATSAGVNDFSCVAGIDDAVKSIMTS